MSLIKQVRGTILSALSKLKDDSSLQPTELVPVSAADTKSYISQKIIDASLSSAKEFIASAQSYREQDDLYRALEVYSQGLRTISSDDPEYTSLVKEKQKITTVLKQRSRDGFYHLLPFDILYLIFGNLEYMDLLRCARVCRRWLEFLLEWPKFWSKLSLGMPSMDQSTLSDLLHGQTQEVHLEGPINYELVEDILLFLGICDNNNFIQRICIKNTIVSIPIIKLLSNATIRMLSSLKQIELSACRVNQQDIIQHLLPACSPTLTHASFSLYDDYMEPESSWSNHLVNGKHFTVKLFCTPYENPPILPSTTASYYSNLTYLKLGTYYHPRPRCEFMSNGIYEVAAVLIKKCPKLVHLFLGSNTTDPRHLSRCFLEAIKSCPQLKNLIIYKNAHMPQTVISNIDKSEYEITTPGTLPPFSDDSSFSPATHISKNSFKNKYQLSSTFGRSSVTTTTALRRFVFGYSSYGVETKDLIEVFKSCHASLELLYLSYDDMVLGPIALNKLAAIGCPNLKEIRLSTDDGNSIGGGPSKPVISAVLIQLFSVCPSLEVIKLEESPKRNYRYLKLNGSIIETIAKNCPRLRYLHIVDFDKHGFDRNIWRKGFLSFINKASSQLETIKVTKLDHQTAYALVKNLEPLKHLQIRWWIENSGDSNVDKEKMVQQMNSILKNRSGSLVVGPINE